MADFVSQKKKKLQLDFAAKRTSVGIILKLERVNIISHSEHLPL